MSYLSDFYKDAATKKKIKTNAELITQQKAGSDESGNLDFFGEFASTLKPELRDQFNKENEARKVERNKVIDNGLNQGKAWEDISRETGVPLDQVQAYSEQNRPDYGIVKKDNPVGGIVGKVQSFGRNLATSSGDAAANQSLDASQEQILKLIRDPNVPEERRKKLVQLVGEQVSVAPQEAAANTQAVAEQVNLKNQAVQAGKGLVGAVVDPVKNSADRLGVVAASQGINAAVADIDKRLELVKNSKLSNDQKSQLEDALLKAKAGILQDTLQAGGFDQNTSTATMFRKSAADLASTAALVVPANAGISALKTGSTAANVGAGILGGATGGLAAQLGTDNISPGELARSTVIGAGLGGAVPAIGGALSFGTTLAGKDQAVKDLITNSKVKAIGEINQAQLNAEEAFVRSQGITDVARLLPDGTQTKSARLAEIDGELDGLRKGTTDPNTYSSSTVETTALAGEPIGNPTLNKSGEIRNSPTTKAGTFAETSGKQVADSTTTATRARELMKERQQLVDEIEAIKNPTERLTEKKTVVEAEIQKAQQAGDGARAARLQEQQTFLTQEAERAAKVEEYTASGQRKSAAAARTEAQDIEDKITKGYGDDVVTYEKDPNFMKNQAMMSQTIMDNDYERAKRIAMGQEAPPEGVQASSVYEAVKARARAEGDTELRGLLATDSTVPTQGTKAGQFNAAFAYRDPTDPVVAIQDIVKARKNSSLSIPASVTPDEKVQILKLGDDLEAKKASLLSKPTAQAREAYGVAYVNYNKYVNELKDAAGRKTLRQHFASPGQAAESIVDLAGVSKSMNATFDNSFGFKQGWKVLTTHPTAFFPAWVSSWKNIYKTFRGQDVLDAQLGRIASDDFMLNGKFKDFGIDLPGLKTYKGEEFFPSKVLEHLNSKNPASGLYNNTLGKLFKASDVAYTAMQLDMRMNLAKTLITKAEKAGVDVSDPKERKAIGQLINSLTGRGYLGKTGERISKPLNNVFFSPRFAKSNIDALGGHIITGAGGSNFVRKEAAMNLVKMAAVAGSVLTIADQMMPGSVEWDPRSSDAGKIKIGNTRFDVTGGLGSFVTAYARQATGSTKSASSGEVKSLTSGDPFADNRWDALWRFTENKFSPAAGAARDIIRGEDFNGKQPTPKSVAAGLVTPMMIGNYNELKNTPNAAPLLLGMVADGLGISTNTYDSSTDWNTKRSQGSVELKGFKQKVGQEKFDKANTEYNDKYNKWFSTIREDPKFWKLSLDDRSQYVTVTKQKLRDDILKSYGYEYKKASRTDSTKKLISELDKYK